MVSTLSSFLDEKVPSFPFDQRSADSDITTVHANSSCRSSDSDDQLESVDSDTSTRGSTGCSETDEAPAESMSAASSASSVASKDFFEPRLHPSLAALSLPVFRRELEDGLHAARGARSVEVGHLHKLVALAQESIDREAARPHFEEALAIYRETLGEKNIEVALLQSHMAALAEQQGRTEAVVELCREAIPTLRAAGEQQRTAGALIRWGHASAKLGNLKEAVSLSREGFTILRSVLGRRNIAVVIVLESIGDMEVQRGRLDKAMGIFKEVTSIKRGILGQESPEVATTLAKMGDVDAQQGRRCEAIALHREALKIQLLRCGQRHSHGGASVPPKLTGLGPSTFGWKKCSHKWVQVTQPKNLADEEPQLPMSMFRDKLIKEAIDYNRPTWTLFGRRS